MSLSEKSVGIIYKVSGPLVVASNMGGVNMHEVVRIGEERLIGEVIELRGDMASIQVYEDTAGIGTGEPVFPTGEPLSVELAPGLIGGIFDGIERPLTDIRQLYGDRISRGIDVNVLNRTKKWQFKPTIGIGDYVKSGDILGTVEETAAITQSIMVPQKISGTVEWIGNGDYTIIEPIAKIKDESGEIHEVAMLQKWPVRVARPYISKLAPTEPMITGQRIIDSLFPIAKGGVAAIPGPFGSGKTCVLHQFAKWCDADVIIYIGCGERGNEMTDVLKEFPKLNDPRTGLSIMKKTVLIANTSDMPVAAREASIYTGITISEYFRDMGYKVAIIADSTSRWAEALREMSGRLEEMPGDEGYPAYLATRLSEFYERAGVVRCQSSEKYERFGSITAIGAVSPPGGDTSEPVSQGTLRIVKVFWGLSAELAYKRHFPAIDWLKSYSLYENRVFPYFDKNVSPDWSAHPNRVKAILDEEAALNEVVKLVGFDSLSDSDKTTLECARFLREDFLQQDAFRDIDRYTSLRKQAEMLDIILCWYDNAAKAVKDGISYKAVTSVGCISEIAKMKYQPEEGFKGIYNELKSNIASQFEALYKGDDRQ